MLIALFLYFLSGVFGVLQQTSQNTAKAEARKLLADGFGKDQDHKALELILSMLSGYSARGGTNSFDGWFLFIFGLVIFLGIVFAFAPHSTLGIGKGESSISRQRWWIHVVSKWLVGGVVLAIITALFRSTVVQLLGF